MPAGAVTPYRVVTDRLVIRCYEPADAPLLKEAVDASIDDLRPWLPWAREEPQSLEAKVELLRRFRGKFDLDQDHVMGIFSRDESALIGGTGLHPCAGPDATEIGYWIASDHAGRGYATEATAALTRVAFSLIGAQRVEIHVDRENSRSITIPRRLGFVEEAVLRRQSPRSDGTLGDLVIFTMFREDFVGSPCAGVNVEAFDAAGSPLV